MHEDAKHFDANGILVNQEWLKLVVSLSCQRKESIQPTSDHCFDFSRSNDNFEELAKGCQPKNTKLSNSWALKIYSEWAKAHWEHMAQSNFTEMSLVNDNRDMLCEELLCILRKKEQQTSKVNIVEQSDWL